MRLRRDNRAGAYLEQSNIVLLQPEKYKGEWKTYFKNDNPIHVEFGCGKGGFITELAKRNPTINYIAIERAETVVYKACKKIDRQEESETMQNLVFLNYDVHHIAELFAPNEVSRIYLNFSDPWPKNRHANRRLTHRSFLAQYQIILDAQGEVHFKTDNKNLFAFSIEEFSHCQWLMKNVTLDLHNSPMQLDNIMTEYETKFSELGYTINRLEAIPPKEA